MAWKIKADVVQTLDDWKAGKPVRAVELGHVHRMKQSNEPTMMPSIDMSKRFHNDQERAYAYCFHLIDLFNRNGLPDAHEDFLLACGEYAQQFSNSADLTQKEMDGAVSLAWKALLVGWKRAIDGHGDSAYIEVSNPAPWVQAT